MAQTYNQTDFVTIFPTLPDRFVVFRRHEHGTSMFRVCDPSIDGDEIAQGRRRVAEQPDTFIWHTVAMMRELGKETHDHARDE
jgi:hypothetical protein